MACAPIFAGYSKQCKINMSFLGVETIIIDVTPKIIADIGSNVSDLGVGEQRCLTTPEFFENQGRQIMNICSYAQIMFFSR